MFRKNTGPFILSAFVAVVSLAFLTGCTGNAANVSTTANSANTAGQQKAVPDNNVAVNLKAPAAMEAEHEKLHENLAKVISSGGKTAEAGKAVEAVLSKHFEHEEEFALPQLGLLPALADGKFSEGMRPAIALSDRLKTDMPKMLDEHKELVKALEALAEAGKTENKADAVAFAEALTAHAKAEEEVSYPTAILVGEYLRVKLP